MPRIRIPTRARRLENRCWANVSASGGLAFQHIVGKALVVCPDEIAAVLRPHSDSRAGSFWLCFLSRKCHCLEHFAVTVRLSLCVGSCCRLYIAFAKGKVAGPSPLRLSPKLTDERPARRD